MESKNRYQGVNEYAVEVIRYRAKTLIGTAGYTKCDLEDIEQDLMLDLFERLEKYDDTKAKLTTFIDRIVDHKIANLIEERQAAKRDISKTSTSLETPFELKNGLRTSLMDSVSHEEYLERMGLLNTQVHDHHILQIDIERVMRHFTPEDQKILSQLKEKTIAEAARDLGIPRTNLNRWIKRWRKVFRIMIMD